MDAGILAGVIASQFLVPFLQRGIEKLRDQVADKAGGEAAEFVKGTTQKVWEKVHSLFKADGDEAFLQRLKSKPDSAAGQQQIQEMLTEKLAAHPEAAEELQSLVNTPGPHGKSASNQITNAGLAVIVSVSNSDFRNARHVNITGLSVGNSPPLDSEQKDNSSESS